MDNPVGVPPVYIDYARRALRTARLVFDDGDWISAINRAYYAIFYAANALLEREGLQRSKHSGVLNLFHERFIKTGVIEAEYARLYGQAFEARNEGDYELVSPPGREDARRAIANAERFLARIERFLSELK